jgi:hypothetical protein
MTEETQEKSRPKVPGSSDPGEPGYEGRATVGDEGAVEDGGRTPSRWPVRRRRADRLAEGSLRALPSSPIAAATCSVAAGQQPRSSRTSGPHPGSHPAGTEEAAA